MRNVLADVLKSAFLLISVSPYHSPLVLALNQEASSSHIVPISVFLSSGDRIPLFTLPNFLTSFTFTENNRCCICVDVRDIITILWLLYSLQNPQAGSLLLFWYEQVTGSTDIGISVDLIIDSITKSSLPKNAFWGALQGIF